MKNVEDAVKATNEYDGAELDDKPIVVRIVEDRKSLTVTKTKETKQQTEKPKKPKVEKKKKEFKPLE